MTFADLIFIDFARHTGFDPLYQALFDPHEVAASCGFVFFVSTYSRLTIDVKVVGGLRKRTPPWQIQLVAVD